MSEVELRRITPEMIPDERVRSIDWTNQQKEVAALHVTSSLRRVAETSRPCTTFLVVGDRHVRIRFDDVTDPAARLQATKEMMETHHIAAKEGGAP